MNTDKLIKTIQKCLTPDLLKREFRKQWGPDNPMYGHCYVATETLYHLLGGEDSGYKPCRAKDDGGIIHWWLEHKETGERLDVTAEQYTTTGRRPPYAQGRGCGFLTKEPSGRAAIVIKRVTT